MINQPRPLDGVFKILGLTEKDVAETSVLLLPENIGTATSVAELFDADDSGDFAKYLKSQGLRCKTAFDFGSRIPTKDRRAIDVWLGVVWILEHLAAPAFANLLGKWLTNQYLEKSSDRQLARSDDSPDVHIVLRIQNAERLSSISFDGPAADLLAILEGIKQMQRHVDAQKTE